MAIDLFRLPKAELHLHIEGTLEPETVMELADANGVRLPYADEDALRAAYSFRDLQEFLDLYSSAMATLLTADDFHLMASRYYATAAAQGVKHAEIFCDPQAHVGRGVRFEEMLAGLTQAVADAERDPASPAAIACALRDQPVERPRDLRPGLAHRDSFIGIGLGRRNVRSRQAVHGRLHPRRARRPKRVAHAGEVRLLHLDPSTPSASIASFPASGRPRTKLIGPRRVRRPHGLPAVERGAEGRAGSGTRCSACSSAASGHDQLRRPGLLRRLRGRQFLATRRRHDGRPGDPAGAQLDRRLVRLGRAQGRAARRDRRGVLRLNQQLIARDPASVGP